MGDDTLYPDWMHRSEKPDPIPVCIKIAAKMLDMEVDMLRTIYPVLCARLIRANCLAIKANGEIISRQVVAAMIEQWERDKLVANEQGMKEPDR